LPRVKKGVTAHHRHKKVLNLTKGHRASNHSLYKRANESMMHSLRYAYVHRHDRKGDMRKLWISRINAASRTYGITYSQLMNTLKVSGIDINRKILAEMAVNEPDSFAQLVKIGQAS
jgi:large subunit ribosomal protein L20